MPKDHAIAKANSNVKAAEPKAAYSILYPTSNINPNPASKMVVATASVGIILLGANELTCAV